jgi:hypothetical protein
MAKYEVTVKVHWYRGLGYQNPKTGTWKKTEDNSWTQGDEYCRVIVEAESDWDARHAAIKPAADHYRNIFEEAYCGAYPERGGRTPLAPEDAVVGTVTELGPQEPFI